jgi:hypothetical protein
MSLPPHSVVSGYDTDDITTHLANGDDIFKKHIKGEFTSEDSQWITPDLPEFKISGKMTAVQIQAHFKELCSYLKSLSDYESGETRKLIKDTKAETLREVALMIFANTSMVEGLNPGLNEIRVATSRNITAAKTNQDLNSAGFKSITLKLEKQGTFIEKGFSNLIPTEGSAAATNLETLRKDFNNDLMASEDRTLQSIRTSANELRTHQKNLPKQTGTGNGIPATGPATTPPPTQQHPQQSGQQPPIRPRHPTRAPPEEITVQRQVVEKDENGHYIQTWRDVAAKKRGPNPNFVFSDNIEANRKAERKRNNDKIRAGKELMIYGLPTPLLPDRNKEIDHVMAVANELRQGYIGAEGFNIQKPEMLGVQVTRL